MFGEEVWTVEVLSTELLLYTLRLAGVLKGVNVRHPNTDFFNQNIVDIQSYTGLKYTTH